MEVGLRKYRLLLELTRRLTIQCECRDHALLSPEIIPACPGCQHIRCTDCAMESIRFPDPGSKNLEPVMSTTHGASRCVVQGKKGSKGSKRRERRRVLLGSIRRNYGDQTQAVLAE